LNDARLWKSSEVNLLTIIHIHIFSQDLGHWNLKRFREHFFV